MVCWFPRSPQEVCLVSVKLFAVSPFKWMVEVVRHCVCVAAQPGCVCCQSRSCLKLSQKCVYSKIWRACNPTPSNSTRTQIIGFLPRQLLRNVCIAGFAVSDPARYTKFCTSLLRIHSDWHGRRCGSGRFNELNGGYGRIAS